MPGRSHSSAVVHYTHYTHYRNKAVPLQHVTSTKSKLQQIRLRVAQCDTVVNRRPSIGCQLHEHRIHELRLGSHTPGTSPNALSKAQLVEASTSGSAGGALFRKKAEAHPNGAAGTLSTCAWQTMRDRRDNVVRSAWSRGARPGRRLCPRIFDPAWMCRRRPHFLRAATFQAGVLRWLRDSLLQQRGIIPWSSCISKKSGAIAWMER